MDGEERKSYWTRKEVIGILLEAYDMTRHRVDKTEGVEIVEELFGIELYENDDDFLLVQEVLIEKRLRELRDRLNE